MLRIVALLSIVDHFHVNIIISLTQSDSVQLCGQSFHLLLTWHYYNGGLVMMNLVKIADDCMKLKQQLHEKTDCDGYRFELNHRLLA